jgi:uncharacterized linocin/CFP29 family protein
MDNLFRELAPISSAAWEEIEEEAKRTLKLTLAARKLVDFTGPLGWATSAVELGRTESLRSGPRGGVEARLREVQPLVELRVPFELSRRELDSVDRGGKAPDLGAVTDAARTIAMAEDQAVFHGFPSGRIEGVAAAAGKPMRLTADFEKYPRVVAEALSQLRNAGVAGPYGIALGPRCYTGLTETTTSGGYRVFDHVRRLLDGGPVVWAPAVDGAVVLSQRGGDFELVVGQDLSIGYLSHSEDSIRLYLEESFTFRVLAPEAAVALAYGDSGGRATARKRS